VSHSALFTLFTLDSSHCTLLIARSIPDPWHFQNFHISFITLFTLVTLNDWSNVMQVCPALCV
jgi:hypothetical protein